MENYNKFNQIEFFFFLGKRFPETLNTKDNLGRTPLHYAAVLSDDGFIYKTLTDFGGDLYIKDDVTTYLFIYLSFFQNNNNNNI